MSDKLAENITEALKDAQNLFYRLIIVAAPSGSGKTAALQKVSQIEKIPLINVNLGLSERMLELTEKQRAIQAGRLLNDIIDEKNKDRIILDNIEILFDSSLKLDPLRLLQKISRNKTLHVAWNGTIK